MRLITCVFAAIVAVKAMPIASSNHSGNSSASSGKLSSENCTTCTVEVDETIITEYSADESGNNSDKSGTSSSPFTGIFEPSSANVVVYRPGDSGMTEVDPSTIKWNKCNGYYRFVLDRWHIQGGSWQGVSSNDEAEGRKNLKQLLRKCGIVTGYDFWFPRDNGTLLDFGWKAKFNLPVGQKNCLEKVLVKAAGYDEHVKVKQVDCHYKRNLW